MHRRKHTPEFNAQVALETIQGLKTASEIANEFEIHPVTVRNWKKELLAPLQVLFESKDTMMEQASTKEKKDFLRKVDQLTMEVYFLDLGLRSVETRILAKPC